MESTELIRESLRAISSEPSEQAESGSSALSGSGEGADAIIDPTLFHNVRVQYAKARNTILLFSHLFFFVLWEYFCRVRLFHGVRFC